MVVRRRSGAKSAAMLGRLSVPAAFFCLPRRGLGQERADQNQRDGRQHARHQRVAPRRMRVRQHRTPNMLSEGRLAAYVHAQPVDGRDHDAAERRKRLRVAEHFLAPLRLGEQLGEPRDCRDELDAHADEHEAAQHEQHLDRGRVTRQKRGDRINQDAVGQHATAAEPVGEVSTDEAENPSRECRDVKQPPTHI